MANVFRATQKHGGSFQASDLVMQINGNSLASHVVQQVGMQYQQQISQVFEIGSNNVYYVGGRANGTMNIARIAGPEQIPGILITAYNDICSPGEMKLSRGSSKCASGGAIAQQQDGEYALDGVIMTSLGINTQAQEVVVNEQMAFQFIDLDVT